MKYILPFVTLSLLLTGCSPRSPRDVKIQKELTGSWSNGLGDTVIASDGAYHCQMTSSDGKITKVVGTMIAKNGVLIDTLTSTTQTNISVPQSVVWHSFKFSNDGRELDLIGNNGATQATLRKVEK